MDHLRLLLADPGRDMPALELMTGDPTIGASPGIEILDGQATSAYRRRIAQIDDELDTADRTGDEGRAAVLDLERRNIIAELSRATGLGGRIRTTNDAAERARINVTRNVKRAIGHLARHAPTAAAHLTASIRTGTYCGYYPGPGGPDHWQF